ncbi:hypothetical protein [Maribacter sp. 4G9]|uniref:hypothetical protein n=1 Tax=Maribacter sp. 4G9 TaxID=1889777 RepID=UPI000C153463|nr:hypothetical protein [Maribacter sp. 4G9]PIB38295.1 hypothetical protein BFP75_17060 [Maribacter sp. 4G9]
MIELKPERILKEYSAVLSRALTDVSKTGPKNYRTIELALDEFQGLGIDAIKSTKTYLKLIDLFLSYTDPCVYWFEIRSPTEVKGIWNSFGEYKARKLRTVPYKKKVMPEDTNVLYLGKVKKGLLRRLKEHLGYTDSVKTQSLQLIHWALGYGIKIKIHVMEFEQETSNLVGVFEFKLAREIRPLLGRHST